ncbi:MAG: phage portal protein [Oscillospiraceae bacterium]
MSTRVEKLFQKEGEKMRFFGKDETREITPSTDTNKAENNLLISIINGEKISAARAMNIPSFSACVEFIANTIAFLPIKLYKEENGETQEVINDYRLKLLNDETGDTLDSFQMKKAFIIDYLTQGNGYIFINRERNIIKSLHYVDAENVNVTSNCEQIFKSNDFYVSGTKYRDFEFIKILRNSKNGGTGKSIVEESNYMLSVVYNSLIFENNLAVNGGNKKGFLKSSKKLAKEALEELKLAWKNLYSNNQNNMMILNDGVEFSESSNSSVEMQLNENKKTNNEEICKLFNLSSKIIAGSSTDSEYISAIKTAIIPKLVEIQTALDKELLLESEKGSFYFSIDTVELLKGDIEKRFKAYQIALNSNFMQIDEVRYKEDLKPLGFNYIKLGLQDVLLNPKTNEIYTPNTNATANLSQLTLKNKSVLPIKGGEE